MTPYPILLTALSIAGLALLLALGQLTLTFIRGRHLNLDGLATLSRRFSSTGILHGLTILTIFGALIGLGLQKFAELWMVLGLIAGIVAAALVGLFSLALVPGELQSQDPTIDSLDQLVVPIYRSGQSAGLMIAGAGLAIVASAEWLSRAEPTLLSEDVIMAIALGATLSSLVLHVAGGRSQSDVSLSVTPFADPVQEAKGIAGIHLDAIRAAVDEFAIYVTTLAVAGWVSANTYGDNSFWGDLPLLLAGVTLAASILSGLLVGFLRNRRVMGTLYLGLILTLTAALAGGSYALDSFLGHFAGVDGLLPSKTLLSAYGVGLALVVILSLASEYFLARTLRPARLVAQAAEQGVASNIVAGLSLGLKSSLTLIALALAAMFYAYYLGATQTEFETDYSFFCVVLALTGVVSMFSTIGGIDAFGSGLLRAGKFILITRGSPGDEMSGFLENIGRSIQGVSRTIVLIAGAVTSGLLLIHYVHSLGSNSEISLNNPATYAFLLLGGFLPCWFAGKMMDGRLDRENETGALSFFPKFAGLTVPLTRTLTLVLVPILVVGLVTEYADTRGQVLVLVGGFLISMLLTVSVLVGAGVWSSAKRRIEMGHSGGVYSEAYAASVAGESVGGSLQNAFAPTLLALLNLLLLGAVLITPVLLTL